MRSTVAKPTRPEGLRVGEKKKENYCPAVLKQAARSAEHNIQGWMEGEVAEEELMEQEFEILSGVFKCFRERKVRRSGGMVMGAWRVGNVMM